MSSAKRQTAAFPKSVWGDRFLNYNHHQEKINRARQWEEIEKLKEEVRKELLSLSDLSLSQQLELIDTIQSLGLEHYFESEIKHGLKHIYDTYYDNDKYEDNDEFDLHIVALSFRLLREHGYHVSSGVFNKFKDNTRKFKENLTENTSGMLSLYEAAYLGINGEEILDEAIIFTTPHLQSMVTKLKDPLASRIKHALHHPQRKRAIRIESRRNISIYQEDCSHNKAILKLAKLDFNYRQSIYKQELYEMCRMWKDLDFTTKLPFARDRVVECYFWILLISYEYDSSLARKLIGKILPIISLVDDVYDAYGTPEELQLFTKAISRWDVNCMDQLPNYMKIIYKVILDFFGEIEEELRNRGWSYRTYYAIESFKNLVHNYYAESRWLLDNQTPTLEEYLEISLPSSSYTCILMVFCVGFDDITEENLKWLLNRSEMVRAGEFIGRVLNDITSHKFERDRGHVASSVECYMNDYGISEQEASKELYKLVDSKWKEINEEFLNLHERLPRSILKSIANIGTTSQVFYDEDDLYTRVGEKMQAYIQSVLINPIPM